MSYTGFDGEGGEQNFHDDMESKLRHYRKIIRRRDYGEESAPSIDILEGLVQYCIEKQQF